MEAEVENYLLDVAAIRRLKPQFPSLVDCLVVAAVVVRIVVAVAVSLRIRPLILPAPLDRIDIAAKFFDLTVYFPSLADCWVVWWLWWSVQ